LNTDPSPGADAASIINENAARARDRAQRKHVLIVDTNPLMATIVGHILERAKLQFSMAKDGKEAIDFCRKTDYDLVLVEAHMPGVDGLVMTEKIRRLSPHNTNMPIIALATKFSAAAVKKNREIGITDELKKPIIEFNLMQLLAKHLGIETSVIDRRPPEDDEIYAILDEDEMSLLNWETLKEYNAVMKDEYKVLMRKFLKASPDLIGDIGEAVVDQNASKIEFLSHKLKSTSLIFGAEGVSNVAAQLELLGRDESLEHAGQYYKELHISYERVKPVLIKKLVQMENPV